MLVVPTPRHTEPANDVPKQTKIRSHLHLGRSAIKLGSKPYTGMPHVSRTVEENPMWTGTVAGRKEPLNKMMPPKTIVNISNSQ